MRKRVYLILVFCMSFLTACHKDDVAVDDRTPGNLPQPNFDGLMYDGGEINTYILYCMGGPMHKYDTSIKTIDSYSKMCLSIEEKYQIHELTNYTNAHLLNQETLLMHLLINPYSSS